MGQKKYYGFHLHCKHNPIKPIVLNQMPVEESPPSLEMLLSKAKELLPTLDFLPVYATLEEFVLNEAGQIIGQYPGKLNGSKQMAIIFEREKDGLQCIELVGHPKYLHNNHGLQLKNDDYDVIVLRLY